MQEDVKTDMGRYAIETKGLVKKYKDVVAVDNLNLAVCEGETYALLGVNGAGKTTTIRMLACLTAPTAGDAILLGKSIRTEASAIKSAIALSPQETAIAPTLSVRENLELIAGVNGIAKDRRESKIRELCDMFDLHTLGNKRAGKLSGGWQRRLSIAMALISEPRILIMDEPTLGLDVIARSELWEIIRSLKGRVTVILTTHYMEEAEALADRVGIMKSGRLLVSDTPENIKSFAGVDRFEEAFIRIVKEEKT